MDRLIDPTSLEFTLAPASLPYVVDVRLRRSGERWSVIADVQGRTHIGIGTSPRAALTAALTPLGKRAVTLLLADTGLLEPSVTLAGLAVG
jgi:hypothetical protein